MTFTVEDGTGVAGANSFVTVAYITAYLTDRQRETQNTWSTATAPLQQAAAIAATDHINKVNRGDFKGQKENISIDAAKATLTFTDQPGDSETITIGVTVYTFNTVLGGANSVLIGANTTDSIDNLVAAINAGTGEGTLYGTGTVQHPDANAVTFDLDTLVVTSNVNGTGGNSIVTTSTVSNATWNFATLNGGSDTGDPQPLEFPRVNAFDDEGLRFSGMPDILKQATSEYAVRSLNVTGTAVAQLTPDPAITTVGVVTKLKEKLGPLEEETEYLPGTYGTITVVPIPEADRILRPLLKSRGGVIR